MPLSLMSAPLSESLRSTLRSSAGPMPGHGRMDTHDEDHVADQPLCGTAEQTVQVEFIHLGLIHTILHEKERQSGLHHPFLAPQFMGAQIILH